MISPYAVLVLGGLYGGASWVGVWVELALGALFNTRYFRFGPCLSRFSQTFRVRVLESEIRDLLQDVPFLATRTPAPDTILIRERLWLFWFSVNIPPVPFTRTVLTTENANGSSTIHMELRPHLSCLLFLLSPAICAVLVLATNSAPNVALFLVAPAVLWGTLAWLQLRWNRRRARWLWDTVVAAIEASPQRD